MTIGVLERGVKIRTSSIGLVIAYGLYALFVIMLTPSLVSSMVSELDFSLQQTAEVISASMVGAIFGTILVLWRATRIRFRSYFLAALVVLTVADLLTAFQIDALSITLTFLLRGFASGIVGATALIFFARDARKEGIFGALLGLQLILSALGVYFMPTLIQEIGWLGLFVATSLTGLVLCLTVSHVHHPDGGPTEVDEVDSTIRLNWLSVGVVLVLCSYLLHFVANSGIWTFLEQIGRAKQLDAQSVADALALSMIVGGVLAVIPGVLGTRFGRSLPLLGSICFIMLSALVLAVSTTTYTFAIAAIIFNSALSVGVPYYQGLLAELDPSGRALTVGGLVLFAGFVLGPLLGAGLETAIGFNGMLTGMAIIFALALLVVAPVVVQSDRGAIHDRISS